MPAEPERVVGDAGDPVPGLPPSLLVVATVRATVAGFLVPYAQHLRAKGWRVDAAARGAAGDPALEAAFDNVYELPLSRSVRDLRSMDRGRRTLDEILATGPDIVHVHTPIAAFLTRLAVRRMRRDRRPAIAYTAHGFHFHEDGSWLTNIVFLTAERVAGRWTDRLVVINAEDEAAALRHRIVPRRRLVHMPGIGLDTARYARAAVAPDAPSEVRIELGIRADAPVFVIVGELNWNKRQRDAVAALAAMRNRDAHLILLGGGPLRAALEALAIDLGVSGRVHFAGFVPDVRPAVCAATAVILPSKREGLARSVMEALSLETPVIVSTARGNRELVGTDAGIQYPAGDVAALAAAMDRLVDDPDEARAMGVRGRSRMVDQFDIEVLLRLHDTLYAELIAERSARPPRL
jgi:glycosyltransferase involved in cell wall biosynthesis